MRRSRPTLLVPTVTSVLAAACCAAPLGLSAVALAQQTGAPLAAPLSSPRADTLLTKVEARMKAIHSLSADTYVTRRYPASGDKPAREFPESGSARLLKPNLSFQQYYFLTRDKTTGDWKKDGPPWVTASDGKFYWFVSGNEEYHKRPLKNAPTVTPLWDFFTPKESFRSTIAEARKKGELTSFSYAGKETWEGAEYDVVAYAIKNTWDGKPHTQATRIYIGEDSIVHRMTEDFTFGDRSGTAEYLIRNLQINAPMKPSEFAYAPPPGAKSEAEVEASRPKLLAAGTIAPDFTIQDRDGKPLKLSDYRGKVVIIDFWATWCGPCMQSMPHTAKVAQQFADKNAVVLAVNVWDEKEAFDKWLPQHPEFAPLTFAIDTAKDGKDIATHLYNVAGIPTQYVIDPHGKIVASFVGYSGPSDALKNAILKAAGSQL